MLGEEGGKEDVGRVWIYMHACCNCEGIGW